MNAAIVSAPLILVLALIAAGHWIAVAQTPAPACGDERIQAHVRAIMNEALDVALQAHVQSLFVVLMKEVQTDGKADRASAGVRIGITSYLRGRDLVEKWSLPQCR